jgi:hypothetical protein
MTSTKQPTSRGGQTDSLPQPADTSADLLEMSVGDALREAAAQAPDHIAIVEGTAGPRRQLTYTGLPRRSRRRGRC